MRRPASDARSVVRRMECQFVSWFKACLLSVIPAWIVSFSVAYLCTLLFIADEAMGYFDYLTGIFQGDPKWGYAWGGIQIFRYLLFPPVFVATAWAVKRSAAPDDSR